MMPNADPCLCVARCRSSTDALWLLGNRPATVRVQEVLREDALLTSKCNLLAEISYKLIKTVILLSAASKSYLPWRQGSWPSAYMADYDH